MNVNCHCGNVQISAASVPDEVAQCNCSICRRYAASWAYYTPQEVTVEFKQEKSVHYIWGDKEVEFHRCRLCGCITHYVTTPECDADIFAINMQMAEPELLSTIPVRKIDGASY
ncbi:GFA family protein [Photobacterium atrarenae]|uniref:Aldehyde-activating protein n=1 Tax=Photobacterium atrarenae TaxID=865757 RepID=A0ABY5GE00_9GAMM|nr:aldehyde-activating protein [Photobacterium atrarenae]UTV26593.1 aldehyde-activating protein [Photobacterium atrarenae]